MTAHLTARLAWHDDGWNGRVCKQPRCNTYCVGAYSFPGDVIARERDIQLEEERAGQAVADLAGTELPPCVYSVNAFGPRAITGYSNPPDFFYGGASRTVWEIPAATVCVWPYEAMYADNVRTEQGFLDNDQRSANAEQFFEEIEHDRSLIFYYANYSNPFSDTESPRYVIIGASRVKSVGERLVYQDADERVRERYAGGAIWARNVSTHYPDEGLRLPYHAYRDDVDAMGRLAVFPENSRTCKYGSRIITDDEAIGLLEQLLSAVQELQLMGDESEDWKERERWLLDCIADLWGRRGLYPGLLSVISFLGAERATLEARALIERGESKRAHELFFSAVDGEVPAPELGLVGRSLSRVRRRWQLQSAKARQLLQVVIPRIDLDKQQIARVVNGDPNDRLAHGLVDHDAIVENPYCLCESYVGDDPDDMIPWATVDRAVLPSPELSGEPLADMETDDPRRLRSLCVEQLRRERNQTFRSASEIVKEVNGRLAKLPGWKTADFTLRHFQVDREELSEALVLREEGGRLWLYLKDVYEDERTVEDSLTRVAGRPAIALDRPFTDADWRDEIRSPSSPLMQKARDAYEAAVASQATACAAIYRQPLAVVTGSAGTGKTSVICAIVRAIRRTEGQGSPVTVLAPTGKASYRVRATLSEREIEGVATSTVHSFLARNGWLNENLTFKRQGGARAGSGTLIIDEASMLDLGLMATLLRALDLRQIKRLILVGDRNQLPPIGRGRVFADILEWLSGDESKVAYLEDNLRQLENRVEDRGAAILELAELFIGGDARGGGTQTSEDAEALIGRVHAGGTVDKDLHVEYWDEGTTLSELLIRTIERDMEAGTGDVLDAERPYELWRSAFEDDPAKYQILTPHRGELHGVESLNAAIQRRVATKLMARYGALDGITLFDKVIQYRNRSRSNAIWAYDFEKRSAGPVEVFNGEIGFVQRHSFDRGRPSRLRRFQVKFERKEHLAVGYGSDLTTRGGSERVQDNLELAYAISVHKAQGSEFTHTYIMIPRSHGRALSTELLYTALTRATRHCTLFIEGDVSTLLSARRPENAQRELVNSSLFESSFRAVPDELINRKGWYEEGLIHEALSGEMVRSKSELVIANLLHGRDVPFKYEVPLKAPDGTMCLPDFTVVWNGETWFWEHWGMTSSEEYRARRDEKVAWYGQHFPDRLIETLEGQDLSAQAEARIGEHFSA